MKYYNLKHPNEKVDFRSATLQGQGRDKGLFFPENMAPFSAEFIANLAQISNEEIAYQCVKDFVGDSIPENELRKIVSETIDFDIPLKKINHRLSILELFHGPTLAFKDVGARFMSRCLSYFLASESKPVCVLVATSGDTGGAVAHGFYGVKGIDVVILYPKNRVSPVQEQQLTALGGNIHALELDGDFDDCQALVKQAFADDDLRAQLLISSANSINVARWLPQQIYYALAIKQNLLAGNKSPVISVPSGNFGNLAAGLLAHQRGLPVAHFIAACNLNDVVPQYLKHQVWQSKNTVATISNAMDVAEPSNFVRMLETMGQNHDELKSKISGYSIDDSSTLACIKRVASESHYVLDPHAAVAFEALEHYLNLHPGEEGILLGTAHPVKFPKAVEEATGQQVALPAALQQLMHREKKATEMPVDYSQLKEYLLSKIAE